MEKPQNETVPTSGHKFILNRWKFTLSTVIGYIWIIGIVIAFYKMSGGQLLGLIHLAEVVGVIGITFGVLFFSKINNKLSCLVDYEYYKGTQTDIINNFIQEYRVFPGKGEIDKIGDKYSFSNLSNALI